MEHWLSMIWNPQRLGKWFWPLSHPNYCVTCFSWKLPVFLGTYFRKGREEGSKIILRIGRASKHAHKHAVQTVRYGTCIFLCGSVTNSYLSGNGTNSSYQLFPLVLIFMTFLLCTSWYTDNGLFLTSGRDGKLKVWDPNAQLPIEEFTGTACNVNKR